jgi:hypothetical protein
MAGTAFPLFAYALVATLAHKQTTPSPPLSRALTHMKIIAFVIISMFSVASYGTTCWLEFADSELRKSTGADVLELSLKRASHVFIAEAVTTIKTVYSAKGEESSILSFSTTFEVERYIKGQGPKNTTIKRAKTCGCSYDYIPGVNYVVIANERKGNLYAASCKYIKPAGETWVEIIEEAARG